VTRRKKSKGPKKPTKVAVLYQPSYSAQASLRSALKGVESIVPEAEWDGDREGRIARYATAVSRSKPVPYEKKKT
jgi:hypothetical protein